MDPKTVRKLEKALHEAIADVIRRLGLDKKLPLLPSQHTMEMMAKAATAVYEAAKTATGTGNHRNDPLPLSRSQNLLVLHGATWLVLLVARAGKRPEQLAAQVLVENGRAKKPRMMPVTRINKMSPGATQIARAAPTRNPSTVTTKCSNDTTTWPASFSPKLPFLHPMNCIWG